MPARWASSPRMIGRLEAPGAKLEPVMPGLEKKRSPSVAPPPQRRSPPRHGTGVGVWGGGIAGAAGGVGGGCGARSRLRPGTARETRTGRGEGTVCRRWIGLGAVTWISGNAVAPGFASCAHASPPDAYSNSYAEPEPSNGRFMEDDMVLILKRVANFPV